VSAKRLIDPLLDLGASPRPSTARPIEVLLTTAVDRSVIPAAELSDCIGAVEANPAHRRGEPGAASDARESGGLRVPSADVTRPARVEGCVDSASPTILR